jgi:hypothetical protein
MANALLVRMPDRVGDAGHEIGDLLGRGMLLATPLSRINPLDKLRDKIEGRRLEVMTEEEYNPPGVAAARLPLLRAGNA